MVANIAGDNEMKLPCFWGSGGITLGEMRPEFLSLGASNVQVCTAAMTYGFKIIEDLKKVLITGWINQVIIIFQILLAELFPTLLIGILKS
ncbi:MAG: hypothetical protein CM15mP117_00970 [Alphaproteobacteria bacterium]|nr:MAG: hypothetical protein CM15mP117_00970 [Alphaproteobacteria bacterium]